MSTSDLAQEAMVDMDTQRPIGWSRELRRKIDFCLMSSQQNQGLTKKPVLSSEQRFF